MILHGSIVGEPGILVHQFALIIGEASYQGRPLHPGLFLLGCFYFPRFATVTTLPSYCVVAFSLLSEHLVIVNINLV